MLADVDGVPAGGCCIDFVNGIGAGDQLPEANGQGMPVPPGRIDSIAWILNHYDPNDDPALPLQGTTAQQAASVQAAIWHYSDGFDLTGGTIG
jgi:TQXA domain-containing protein